MDTQEILPKNIEESNLPSSGLDEIEAAMEKISELEQADSDASEQALEENPETKRTNLKDSDAKENPTREAEETQAESTEDDSTDTEQKEKPNKL